MLQLDNIIFMTYYKNHDTAKEEALGTYANALDQYTFFSHSVTTSTRSLATFGNVL